MSAHTTAAFGPPRTTRVRERVESDLVIPAPPKVEPTFGAPTFGRRASFGPKATFAAGGFGPPSTGSVFGPRSERPVSQFGPAFGAPPRRRRRLVVARRTPRPDSQWVFPVEELTRTYELPYLTHYEVGMSETFSEYAYYGAYQDGCTCMDDQGLRPRWLTHEEQRERLLARGYPPERILSQLCSGLSQHSPKATAFDADEPLVSMLDIDAYHWDCYGAGEAWDEIVPLWRSVREDVACDPSRLFRVGDAGELASAILCVVGMDGSMPETVLGNQNDPSVRAATLDIGMVNVMYECAANQATPPYEGMTRLGTMLIEARDKDDGVGFVHPDNAAIMRFERDELFETDHEGARELRGDFVVIGVEYQSVFDLPDPALYPFVPGVRVLDMRSVAI